MLVSPFPPSLAQRFEAGIAGLACGGFAYQTAYSIGTVPEPQTETPAFLHLAIDRFWQRLHDQITQVSQLDRPLANRLELSILESSSPDPQTPESLDWFWLSDLPWLWMLLQDPEGQRQWIKQQPDPCLVLLLAACEDLSQGRHSPDRSNQRVPTDRSSGLSDSPTLLDLYPAAQDIWQTAHTLTERSATLAQGLAHWQTAQTGLDRSPTLQTIGIALWLAWRTDQVGLTLAQAQQVLVELMRDQPTNDRPLAGKSLLTGAGLLPLAGLLGGFAHAPFPWSRFTDWDRVSLDRTRLQQHSDRLYRAWAGYANSKDIDLRCNNSC